MKEHLTTLSQQIEQINELMHQGRIANEEGDWLLPQAVYAQIAEKLNQLTSVKHCELLDILVPAFGLACDHLSPAWKAFVHERDCIGAYGDDEEECREMGCQCDGPWIVTKVREAMDPRRISDRAIPTLYRCRKATGRFRGGAGDPFGLHSGG